MFASASGWWQRWWWWWLCVVMVVTTMVVAALKSLTQGGCDGGTAHHIQVEWVIRRALLLLLLWRNQQYPTTTWLMMPRICSLLAWYRREHLPDANEAWNLSCRIWNSCFIWSSCLTSLDFCFFFFVCLARWNLLDVTRLLPSCIQTCMLMNESWMMLRFLISEPLAVICDCYWGGKRRQKWKGDWR